MGIFFVLCDNFIIFVSVSRAKHKLEDFGEMSGKRCVSFVQWIEGWRCESLKKSLPHAREGQAQGRRSV